MKKNIIFTIAMFFAIATASVNANAQYGGDKSLRALLGFTSGAIHLGADFEVRQSSLMGMGGYFFFQTDEYDPGSVTVYEVLALGAFAPVHLLNDSKVDAYIAPGFGIAMVDNPAPNGDDETTFGPTVKIGVDLKMSPTMKFGLQHFIVTNWLSDDAAGEISFTSAAATFAF